MENELLSAEEAKQAFSALPIPDPQLPPDVSTWWVARDLTPAEIHLQDQVRYQRRYARLQKYLEDGMPSEVFLFPLHILIFDGWIGGGREADFIASRNIRSFISSGCLGGRSQPTLCGAWDE